MHCVLGIETSCDETAVAIYHSERGILAHCIRSQIAMHAEYGGVVPELASRDHIRYTLPLIKETLASAKLTEKDITGVAYTKGPGLVGALLVGAVVGRTLGWAWNVPTIGVHHLEAHLLAAMLEERAPQFPFLALLVSGGHTALIAVHDLGKYEVLGETLDDAVGEAFDKTAKLIGLSYPGGAALEALAKQGNADRFHFPRPMTDRPGLQFSFSGLKTAAVQTLKQMDNTPQSRADLARAFQAAIIDTLVIKSERAIQQTGLSSLVIAGGVGANQYLRDELTKMAQKLNVSVFYPRPIYCTDNGAMVAYAGFRRLQTGQHDGLEIEVLPRWEL